MSRSLQNADAIAGESAEGVGGETRSAAETQPLPDDAFSKLDAVATYIAERQPKNINGNGVGN